MANAGPDYVLEFAHGYTGSAYPVACAAGLAALDVLVEDDLPQRVAAEAPYFESLLHDQLSDKPFVTDVRNYGFAGAITLEAKGDEPLRRPFEVAMAMWSAVSSSDTVAIRSRWRLTLSCSANRWIS